MDANRTASLAGVNIPEVLAGYGRGTIEGSLFSGNIVSSDSYTGGVVGYSDAAITSCASQGSVQGTSWVGGIAGRHSNGTISNCYAKSDVIASNTYSGGFAGYQYNAINENCFVAAQVTSTGGHKPWTGHSSGSTTYINCLWDKEKCSLSYPDIPGQLEGKTTIQMKTISTFTDAGWDFVGEEENGQDDVWRMCVDGVNYPRLAWEFWEDGDFACPDGVEMADYAYFANRWLDDTCSAAGNCGGADMDWSGTIDLLDLYLFCEHWLNE